VAAGDEKKIPAETIPPEPLEDDEASAEALAYASGTLQKEAERAQHGRRERTRDHIGRATIIGVWVAFLVLVLGALIWSWHLLAPIHWRYLEVSEIAAIQALLSNVIIGAVLGFLVRNRFM
jgi:hypothetical protein